MTAQTVQNSKKHLFWRILAEKRPKMAENPKVEALTWIIYKVDRAENFFRGSWRPQKCRLFFVWRFIAWCWRYLETRRFLGPKLQKTGPPKCFTWYIVFSFERHFLVDVAGTLAIWNGTCYRSRVIDSVRLTPGHLWSNLTFQNVYLHISLYNMILVEVRSGMWSWGYGLSNGIIKYRG